MLFFVVITAPPSYLLFITGAHSYKSWLCNITEGTENFLVTCLADCHAVSRCVSTLPESSHVESAKNTSPAPWLDRVDAGPGWWHLPSEWPGCVGVWCLQCVQWALYLSSQHWIISHSVSKSMILNNRPIKFLLLLPLTNERLLAASRTARGYREQVQNWVAVYEWDTEGSALLQRRVLHKLVTCIKCRKCQRSEWTVSNLSMITNVETSLEKISPK